MNKDMRAHSIPDFAPASKAVSQCLSPQCTLTHGIVSHNFLQFDEKETIVTIIAAAPIATITHPDTLYRSIHYFLFTSVGYSAAIYRQSAYVTLLECWSPEECASKKQPCSLYRCLEIDCSRAHLPRLVDLN